MESWYKLFRCEKYTCGSLGIHLNYHGIYEYHAQQSNRFATVDVINYEVDKANGINRTQFSL